MTLKQFYISIFLCSLCLTGFAQEKNSQIQLLQKGSKTPVQYANVCWQNVINPKQNGNTVADFQGKLTIPNIDDEKMILSITCVGYKSVYDTLQLAKTQIIYIEEDVLNLDQVTVTGTRTPHTLKEAPVLTQMITEKEIKSVDSETLTDLLLVEMPGVGMARHGGVPVMNMMGLETQYSLILIDGERMAKGLQKTIDYSRLNAANIEKIEIIRGASSALYGSDAMGGVINVITKKPHKKVDISASVRYQQRNGKDHNQSDIDNADDQYAKDFYENIDRPNLNGNLSVGYRNKNFYSNTFANYKSSDGYKLFDKEGTKKYYEGLDKVLTSEVREEPTLIYGFADYTISQKVGYKNEDWFFELNGSWYEHDEFDFSNDAVHELYRSYTLGGKTSYKVSANSSINLSHSTDIYERFNVDEKEDNKSKTHNNSFHNTKLTYTTQLQQHNLLIGTENLYQTLETDKFVTNELTEKSTNNTVIVLQDEFRWSENLILVAGLRTGYHSTFNFHASPSLSAKYSLGKFNLRLSYARGFRSPDLKELYMNWSHLGSFQILGNKDLKAETNDYYAFSVDFLNPEKHLNATLITSFNKVYDKIDGIWTKNQTEYHYLNLDDAKLFSIEALLKWQLHQNLKLKTAYIFLESIKSADAQDLSSMSPMALTAQLEYRFTKGRYNLTANFSGKISGKKEFNVLDEEEDSPYKGEYYKVKYPAFSIWNFTLNQNFGEHIKIGTGVKNLFDYKAPVVTFNTSSSPGRKFFVSLNYQF